MKLIKPSYEILTPIDWREWGIKKFIELIGRTCYKSEDKITDYSYKVFVQKMIDSRHYAMLEHGTIYITASDYIYYTKLIGDYDKNKYSVVKEHFDEYGNVIHCITTNLRVLIENGWINDLCYLSEYFYWSSFLIKKYLISFKTTYLCFSHYFIVLPFSFYYYFLLC